MKQAKKTAVVTGAGRGLGLEFARQLVGRGFQVLGTVRKPSAALEEVGARALVLDVADAQAVARFADQVTQYAPQVDLLVNNAGINSRGVPAAQANVRFGQLEPEGILTMVRTNAIAPILIVQALSDVLAADAKIVNVSSWLGSIATRPAARTMHTAPARRRLICWLARSRSTSPRAGSRASSSTRAG